jgi:hypothetical protein
VDDDTLAEPVVPISALGNVVLVYKPLAVGEQVPLLEVAIEGFQRVGG